MKQQAMAAAECAMENIFVRLPILVNPFVSPHRPHSLLLLLRTFTTRIMSRFGMGIEA